MPSIRKQEGNSDTFTEDHHSHYYENLVKQKNDPSRFCPKKGQFPPDKQNILYKFDKKEMEGGKIQYLVTNFTVIILK